jgi:multiple sugar transport system ATP-binding protein
VAAIEFHGVSKVFPDGTVAVDSLDLAIGEGEFMVFVGPSGCGKTTALRMVAGLEEISEGEVLIGGRVVNEITPKDRDVAMVFQNYALYPHMTVAANLAFGLKLRNVAKAEIRRRVQSAAVTLGLEEYLERKPAALSGGQRQRVAMGRAIVREPQAYLMDEPLSNLDAKLRVQMRAEIQGLQRSLGVTTIYVTHDQTEAMTMGDRIAVMERGTLQQVDTPEGVYSRPANRFVAGFIGSPAMNMIEARLTRENGVPTVCFGEHRLALAEELIDERPAVLAYEGRSVLLGIRPEDFEDVEFASDAPPERTVTAVCTLRESLGSEVLVHFAAVPAARDVPVGSLASTRAAFVARVDPQTAARVGARVRLAVDTRRLHFFDPDSGLALYGDPAQASVVAAASISSKSGTSAGS